MSNRVKMALGYEAHLLATGKITSDLSGTTREDRKRIAEEKERRRRGYGSSKSNKPLWKRTNFTKEDFKLVKKCRGTRLIQKNDFCANPRMREFGYNLARYIKDGAFKRNVFIKLHEFGASLHIRIKPDVMSFIYDEDEGDWCIYEDVLIHARGDNVCYIFNDHRIYMTHNYCVDNLYLQDYGLTRTFLTLDKYIIHKCKEYIELKFDYNENDGRQHDILIALALSRYDTTEPVKLFNLVAVPKGEMPVRDFIECLTGAPAGTSFKHFRHASALTPKSPTRMERDEDEQAKRAALIRKLF